jgi:DNA polymerase-3 subunit alpha
MSPEGLLQEAKSKGISSLVLTDINNTSGCLSFVQQASKYGVRPLVGIDFRIGVRQLYIGIAHNNEGFAELNNFMSTCLSSGKANVPEKPPLFLHASIIYPLGTIGPETLSENEFIGVKPEQLNKLLFGNWGKYISKLLAVPSVSFRHKKDFNAHRLLRAIGNNTLLSKLAVSEQGKEQDVMYNEADLASLYERFPELLENTRALIQSCTIDFEFGTHKNKRTFTGNPDRDYEELLHLSIEGLRHRYGESSEVVQIRLEKELALIRSMDFVSYFLINHDIVHYARSKNYFCVGRGSGANSIVAYCLGITNVDPIDLDLYFERFINPYRVNPPDFDIDFSWKDRNDVIRHIFDKYECGHVALLATYNTFQQKSVLRELGKVFGLPKEEIDALVSERKNPSTPDHIAELIYKYSHYLHDFPNHLSIHAGGILISEKPLTYYSALTIPPKGFPLVQFSMIEAEDLGLYKFDILSQRGLGHIKDTIEIVKQNQGIEIDIHDLKKFKADEKIKDLLRTSHTMGCFYVESPAMRMLLKKLEASSYLDLVAASSIIRPGVASSGMMREYILRFRDPSRREYVHEKIGKLMSETFGIMVYQEDVIKVAHYFAGLSLAESDVLRRGMSGKFRGREEFQRAKEKFFSNCAAFGYDPAVTLEVWRQIESFAGYSFSKGHSASYAVESFQSLYLKAYFPKEFMVGVINNFGGFYRTEYYIHEARMSGATVLPPCINQSMYLTSIEGDIIYLGFIHLGTIEESVITNVIKERTSGGLFASLEDFTKRVTISLDFLRILIRIGTFRFTGKTKKSLLWEVHMILGRQRQTVPSRGLFGEPSRKFTLPDLCSNEFDDTLDEIEILGFPLQLPFHLLDQSLSSAESICLKDLITYVGKEITIIGYLVTTKNTRTKYGDNMYFGTFLDREGLFFDTTHFPEVAHRFPFSGNGCYCIKGVVVEEFGYPTINVQSMTKLPYTQISRVA